MRNIQVFVACLAHLLLSTLPRLSYADAVSTPEFLAGQTRPVKIALLRAKAEIVKNRMPSAFLELGLSDELATLLDVELERSFESKGYDVLFVDADRLNSDPVLQELAGSVAKRYEELGSLLAFSPKATAKHRYSLGEDAQLLAMRLGVDAIVLPSMAIVAKTPGAIAASWMMLAANLSSPIGTRVVLFVAVVDGASGRLEALCSLPRLRRGAFTGYESVMADPVGKLRPLVDLTMRNLPAADPALRAMGSEKDVVKEIETLLAR